MAHSQPTGHNPHGRDAALNRLHRIEGQVRGIAAMIEQDRYCIDILTQISAASKALRAVALTVLDEHLQRCLADQHGSVSQAKAKEASEAIARLVRS
jgi:CsoR family transcriptional regulator, copper-sensing transcriptional repressor